MRMQDVLGLILGGGVGSRLYPLTKERAKPAVPLAGKYRLIDIPMSNCFHADIEKIAILTQFNSVSLHRHIYRTYNRDVFTRGWVQIWAAEQTHQSADWYQGTADAVRKQAIEIRQAGTEYIIILAGDHLYRMDYRKFVEFHVDSGADVTIAVQPVPRDDASALGILKLNEDSEIVTFREKPKTDAELNGMETWPGAEKPYMASMGIYVFSTDILFELLETKGDDFGRDIIPAAIENRRVMGYVFDGYWEDIGTIRRFYEVNLEMASPNAPFDFYNPITPIYTRARFLPASEVHGAHLHNVLLTDGCRIHDATVRNSVIGLRSIVGPDVSIQSSVIMGADYYEPDNDKEANFSISRPDIGIGAGSVIEGAIIDKNARIGRNVTIRSIPNRPDAEGGNWVSRDGIIIVPKNAVIPDGSVI
ncbi:MAG: glucose-1-phosphate adenylyltransferase [Anaerolineales bacterium]|nr:glucose-1-phosphate adenylyltransferase [Anaerolineales bacterium]MCA9929297.1 glucose-1-phosphate adenylyltransferase [Anaerolineales bacterium]